MKLPRVTEGDILKPKIDYSLRTKTIIKWYEYKMTYPDDESEEIGEDIPDAEEVQKSLEELSDEEEIALQSRIMLMHWSAKLIQDCDTDTLSYGAGCFVRL